jgi:hypothetical protein
MAPGAGPWPFSARLILGRPVSPLPSTIVNGFVEHPVKAVFFLALVVRLVNLATLHGHDAFFAELDSHVYWRLGADLAKNGGFWPTLKAMTDRMPIYPLLLCAVQRAFGDAPRVVALLQSVADAGSCAMIAALGAVVSPTVGLLAGIIAALSINLIVYSTQILTDSLFLFFFTLMLLAGARFMLRPTNTLALATGLSGGFALATRPAVALLLLAAVPVAFVVSFVRRRQVMPALLAATLFAIAGAAPIAPVLLRNAAYYHTWKLTSQTSEHLLSWIVPLVKQRADGTPYQETVDRDLMLYRRRLAELGMSAETDPFRLAAVKSEVAREQMALLPISAYAKSWLDGIVVNVAAPAILGDPRLRALPKPSFYNTAGTTLTERARTYLFKYPGLYQFILLAALASMVPLLALEAVGFLMLMHRLPLAALFGAGIVVYFLLISGPVASAKYRLPIEPVLIVLSAIPLAALIERRRRQTEAKSRTTPL